MVVRERASDTTLVKYSQQVCLTGKHSKKKKERKRNRGLQ